MAPLHKTIEIVCHALNGLFLTKSDVFSFGKSQLFANLTGKKANALFSSQIFTEWKGMKWEWQSKE